MKQLFILLISFLLSISLFSQKKVEVSGYVNNMQSFTFTDFNGDWLSDNLIHNRLNGAWYINDNITFKLDLRSRFVTGDQIRYTPGIKDYYDADEGWIDMSWNIANGKNYVLNSFIDRLWLDMNFGNWNISLGRHRINWGQTFVWNPNDIFNTYSFFDFDYPERPGSDALKIQYYTSYTSSVEAVVKVNGDDKITAAGRWVFNKFGYDFQFLGGIYEESDFTLGAGWSGNIKNIGFRGELNYLHPLENFKDTSGVFLNSISVDYAFSNSAMLQFELLYNHTENKMNLSNLDALFGKTLNIKSMAFSEWNFFGQFTYPISPIINITLSTMYFPDLNGFFTGPSVSVSLADNVDFSFFTQYFYMKPDVVKTEMTMAYLRLKYSF